MTIAPQVGLGYALGWAGVGLMLVGSVGYSLWKRLYNAGLVAALRLHIVLNVAGLACIVVHAGGIGDGNSRMAVIFTSIVGLSGAVGRYVPAAHKAAWQAWHVPLAFVMLACVILHVAASFIY